MSRPAWPPAQPPEFPPVRVPPMRRRGRARWWLIAAAALAVVVMITGLAVVIRLLSAQAPSVPATWTAPTALPRGPALPVDRLAFDSDRSGGFELYTMGHDGREVTRLTGDPAYDSWSPRLSPDRRTILFNRTPRGVHDTDAAQASLWAVGTDGSGLVQLRPVGLDGWVLQGHAEWSPDGSSLVMFGGSRLSPQIHVTDRLGQRPVAVTDRPGTNLDPAFHPDGKSIVFVGCPRAVCTEPDYEIYQVAVGGGAATRLTEDGWRDHDPMWSPDGRRLAWLTQLTLGLPGVWDIRWLGSAQLAARATPRRLVGDDGVTSRPEFTVDGTAVFTHRIPPGGSRFQIFRIPLGGGPAVDITAGQPGTNEYPSP